MIVDFEIYFFRLMLYEYSQSVSDSSRKNQRGKSLFPDHTQVYLVSGQLSEVTCPSKELCSLASLFGQS